MNAYEHSITVIIHTKNSESTLEETLKSVQWAHEILVVDMQSTDNTHAIAKKYKARIESVPDYGYVEPARNKALQLATSNWICIVDSDEVIPNSLALFFKDAAQKNKSIDAYWVARKNILFGGWLQCGGWWPDYQLRFFRKGTVTWSNVIHAQPKVSGEALFLPPQEDMAIIHANYPTVESFLERMNRYTTHELKHRTTKEKTKKQELQHISADMLVHRWSSELLSRVFVHKGVEGGVRGTGTSLLQAMYELLVVFKLWEKQTNFHAQENKLDTNQETMQETKRTVQAFSALSTDLRYWIADWHVAHTTGLKHIWWRLRRSFKI